MTAATRGALLPDRCGRAQVVPMTRRRRGARRQRSVRTCEVSDSYGGVVSQLARAVANGLTQEERAVYLEFLHRAESGFYAVDRGCDSEINYRTLFLQSHRGYDALVAGFVVGQLHAELCNGDAAIVGLRVGHKPQLDQDRELNNELLQNGLMWLRPDCDWSGEVSQDQYHGPDGVVRWDAGAHGSPNLVRAEAFGQECEACLEVGTMHPALLLLRMMDHGPCLARWPYGSEWVYIIGRHAAMIRRQEALERRVVEAVA